MLWDYPGVHTRIVEGLWQGFYRVQLHRSFLYEKGPRRDVLLEKSGRAIESVNSMTLNPFLGAGGQAEGNNHLEVATPESKSLGSR